MEKAIHRHYLHHVSGASPMRFPILQRINPSNYIIHPQNRYLYPKILALKVNMDESSEKSAISKPEVKLAPPPEVKLPLPPEKPLPGDCCGSGCVRCVWDIYFDELDEYDKLCKSSKSVSDSNPNPNPYPNPKTS